MFAYHAGVGPGVDAGERKYVERFLPEKAKTKQMWTKDPAGQGVDVDSPCLDELQSKRTISVSVDMICAYPATSIWLVPRVSEALDAFIRVQDVGDGQLGMEDHYRRARG